MRDGPRTRKPTGGGGEKKKETGYTLLHFALRDNAKSARRQNEVHPTILDLSRAKGAKPAKEEEEWNFMIFLLVP
jgi:hypothetical protein